MAIVRSTWDKDAVLADAHSRRSRSSNRGRLRLSPSEKGRDICWARDLRATTHILHVLLFVFSFKISRIQYDPDKKEKSFRGKWQNTLVARSLDYRVALKIRFFTRCPELFSYALSSRDPRDWNSSSRESTFARLGHVFHFQSLVSLRWNVTYLFS